MTGVRIGKQVTIDRNLQMTRPDLVRIGDRVTISNQVSLLAETTSVHSRLETEFGIYKAEEITICDDAYIGVKATILRGVRVGQMATVAANTLVTADVPDYGVVIGVPGRVVIIRKRLAPESDP